MLGDAAQKHLATGAQMGTVRSHRQPQQSDASLQVATGLTKREVEVIRLVAQGLSNNAIGEQLTISSGTVTRHVSNILNKTALSKRTELAAYAIANKLTD